MRWQVFLFYYDGGQLVVRRSGKGQNFIFFAILSLNRSGGQYLGT